MPDSVQAGEAAAHRPAIPANRYALPRSGLRFFPRLQDEREHPTGWRFPEHLDPAVPWVGVLKELYAWPASFPASISPEAGVLLHSLVRNIRPRTVVEVGSFIGVSTIWIAAALEEASADPRHGRGEGGGVIHAFDDFGPMAKGPWREAEISTSRVPLVEESLRRADLRDRVILHPGNSSEQIRACREQLRGRNDDGRWIGGVDFALIDGDHSVEGALADLWALEPVLNTGGYVVLHDTFPEQCGNHQGPRHILDQIRAEAQGVYEVCELYTAPLNYGMAVMRRVG